MKILFVCTANVCRSPMARAMFDALAGDRGAPFGTGSAGVTAIEGSLIDPKASEVLEELGFYPGAHRSRQVSVTSMRLPVLLLSL